MMFECFTKITEYPVESTTKFQQIHILLYIQKIKADSCNPGNNSLYSTFL